MFEEIVPSDERHRPLITASVALAAGIIFAKYADVSPVACLSAAAIIAVTALIAMRKNFSGLLRDTLVLLLIVGAGAANYAWRDMPKHVEGLIPEGRTLCVLTGTVIGEITDTVELPLIPEKNARPPVRRSTFRLRVETLEVNEQPLPFECDVRVSVQEKAENLRHGDKAAAFGWLRRMNDSTERYATSRGFSGNLHVSSASAINVIREGRGSFSRSLYSIKSLMRNFFLDYEVELSRFSGETITLLTAMILGDRSEMSGGLRTEFSNSGTMHLLAISGLHVGLVYAALSLLCRLLIIKPLPRRILVISVVMAYAAVTGFGPAVTRSAMMILLFELADWLRFRRDPLNTVAAAAIIILAVAPHHLFEAGFQLTFVAVISIILFGGKIARAIKGEPDELERIAQPEFKSRWRAVRSKAWGITANALGVCAAATIAVTPLQAYYFGVFTPVSIFATALLVPVISAFITLGFAFLLVAPFIQFAAVWLAYALSALSWLFVGIVGRSAELPFGHAFVAPPEPVWIFSFYGVLIVSAARKRLRMSPAGALIMPLCFACLYMYQQVIVTPPREMAATFIDVGHGTSVLLNCSGKTVLYDCGAGSSISTYDVGREIVAPALWKRGCRRIDLLILSHNHHDHVNGIPSLLERFNVGQALVSESFGKDELGRFILSELASRKIPVRIVKAGDKVSFAGMRFDILWPPGGKHPWRLSNVNDQSIAIRVSSAGRSLLLTGDVETTGMAGLMTIHRAALESELLYVPHHGSDALALAEFIKMVKPRQMVVSGSAGKKEQLDHVREKAPQAELFSTQDEGTIRFSIDIDGWKKVPDNR